MEITRVYSSLCRVIYKFSRHDIERILIEKINEDSLYKTGQRFNMESWHDDDEGLIIELTRIVETPDDKEDEND